MSLMRLVVAGAAGRMGCATIQAIAQSNQAILSAAIEQPGNPCLGQDAGTNANIHHIGIPIIDDPLKALTQADGIIDFSTPQGSSNLATMAAKEKILHVIGATGFSKEEEQEITMAARHIPIIKSANMSLGINLLAGLVQQAAQILDETFDVEIVEMHHRYKLDAPSGAALMLGQAAAQGRGIKLQEKPIQTRYEKSEARRKGDIGFASVRGGSVIGEHSVILVSDHERIELTHKAENRSIFAHGALQAALWGQGKKPGLYSMADVLGLTNTMQKEK